MCGFIGILNPEGPADVERAIRMRRTLQHRGPDDAGLWHDERVVLGHQRLSVIDLSAQGHQPMTSHCGRFVIAYNGEIYNFEELRGELSHNAYRGSSDTEVLLAAISEWGIDNAVSRLVGMFAFAVYDRESGTLTLVRDRLGIKPLYYGWCESSFVFASELTPFRQAFASSFTVDRDALAGYLRHNYLPGPESMISGISRLGPGQFAELRRSQALAHEAPTVRRYWTPERPGTITATPAEIEERLLEHLRAAVRCRMLADVPLGAFLSGGIDSSLVCALMQEHATRPIQTFTMAFREPEYDESSHAQQVAEHLGCDHTRAEVGESDLLQTVSQLPELLDEPFADASFIPTYLLCRTTRKNVTVALSGDGGDELFSGYSRYALTRRLHRGLHLLPLPLRRQIAAALTSGGLQKRLRGISAPGFGGRRRPLGGRLQTLGELLPFNSEADLYHRLISHWKSPDDVVIGGHEPVTLYADPGHWSHHLPASRRMQMQDLLLYLPGDILTKVDRASMAVGLEARVPLLDHRLVEFCLDLPDSVTSGAPQKQLLQRILARYVPPALTNRPKQGFSVPLDAWLRGPLKEWMLDLLSPETLSRDGYFETGQISRRIDELLSGQADWGSHLWNVLVFQSWLHRPPT